MRSVPHDKILRMMDCNSIILLTPCCKDQQMHQQLFLCTSDHMTCKCVRKHRYMYDDCWIAFFGVTSY